MSSCIQADAYGGENFLPTDSVSCCICMALSALKPYYFALSLECSKYDFFWSTFLRFPVVLSVDSDEVFICCSLYEWLRKAMLSAKSKSSKVVLWSHFIPVVLFSMLP